MADLITTLLEVSIRRRSDATVFWEGRADIETPPGSRGASRAAAVSASLIIAPSRLRGTKRPLGR
mgnify:CR=1 FL=1